jgi:tRNA1(Val) A37 N6-methylase TrmN6
MGESTNDLMKLRPVQFRYKPEYGGSDRMQWGLIAEEVAEIYPELVVHDKNGNPFTVRYQLLNSMLLNELQKQHAKMQAGNAQMQEQRARIALLNASILQLIKNRTSSD